MKLAAEFECMRPDNFRDAVADIQSVVPLVQVRDRNAHDERREDNIFHPLELWRLHHDAGRPYARLKSLRLQGHARAAARLADIVHIAQETSVELIHGGGS